VALKEGSGAWKLANFAGLQIVWFACVLGAAHDKAWAGWLAGLVFVAFHFTWIRDRRPDTLVAAAALLLGAVYETLNLATGVYTTTTDVFPAPAPPSWLLVLWVTFALAIRHSMRWMRGRYLVGALLGAIAGPLSWRGGAALGAVAFGDPKVPWWLTFGIEWGIAMPLLAYVASRAERGASSADAAASPAAERGEAVTSSRAE